MELRPRHLLYLAAIGTHGSFVRAAKSLGISQPALSLTVQRIEDITSARLVDRGRHGARLTQIGKLLARRGAEIDVAVSSAWEDLELLSLGISGKLRVGGTPLATNTIIPEVIGKILSITENVSNSVEEGHDEDLLDMLDRNELDVAISAPGTLLNRSRIKATELFSAKTVLAVRAEHPLAGKSDISLADLANAVWAIPPDGGSFRGQVDALFVVNSIPFPRRTVEASSFHVLKHVLLCSDAVTLVATQFVADEIRRGRLCSLAIKEPIAVRTFGIHQRRQGNMSDLSQLFHDLVIEHSDGLNRSNN